MEGPQQKQIADLSRVVCTAGHSRESAARFNKVVKVSHLNLQPIRAGTLWIQRSEGSGALAISVLTLFSFVKKISAVNLLRSPAVSIRHGQFFSCPLLYFFPILWNEGDSGTEVDWASLLIPSLE